MRTYYADNRSGSAREAYEAVIAEVVELGDTNLRAEEPRADEFDIGLSGAVILDDVLLDGSDELDEKVEARNEEVDLPLLLVRGLVDLEDLVFGVFVSKFRLARDVVLGVVLRLLRISDDVDPLTRNIHFAFVLPDAADEDEGTRLYVLVVDGGGGLERVELEERALIIFLC